MPDKTIRRKEAGWIAEEIFEDGTLNLRNRRLAVYDQVARGVTELNTALDVYEISMDYYMNFIAKDLKS